jgi:hypothetical protein
MTGNGSDAGAIETRIPSRLDRLPWSRFHWMVVRDDDGAEPGDGPSPSESARR